MRPRPRHERRQPKTGGKPPAESSRRRPQRASPPLDRELDLEITNMALDGDGLGRLDGLVVIAPHTLPGERVRVRLRSRNRKVAKAEVLRVLKPAPHRVEPRCRHFGICGGCSWQHIRYEEQLRLKRSMLASLLEKAIGLPPERILEPIGLDGAGPPGKAAPGQDPTAPWGFRSKVHYTIEPAGQGGKPTLGHHLLGDIGVFPIVECPVHAPEGHTLALRAWDVLKGLPAGVGAPPQKPFHLRHLLVRTTGGHSLPHLTIVASRASPELTSRLEALEALSPPPGGVHLNVNPDAGPYILGPRTERLRGARRLEVEVAGVIFRLSPASFFQTSLEAAARLVSVVLDRIRRSGAQRVLDLYAGAGLFALPLAKLGCTVLAIEASPIAVADGIESLRANPGLPGSARFLKGRTEDALEELLGKQPDGRGIDAVILDPPRDGCPPDTWRHLLRELRPRLIIYVSCNPRALCEDLKVAPREGYAISEIRLVDMFPHTAHMESVTILER